jgi:type I restriction enzyme S subunit
MANWRSFEELFAIPLRNGVTRPSAVRGDGVKMVNMGEIFAVDRLDETVTMERVQLSESEAERFLLEPDDLLFARQSIIASGAGKCSLFLGDEEPVTWESHIIRARLDESIANPRFYYYLFNSPSGKRLIWTIVEQVSAAGIRGSDLRKLKVPWVGLDEQDAVADLLSPYDDLISVARRLLKTLESMARALFRAWFVDYEPIDETTASDWNDEIRLLFPEQVDADGGPRGWSRGHLGDIADRIVERLRNPEEWAEEELVDLGRIPRRAVAIDDWGSGAELTSSITRFRDRDILFGGIRPYLHKVGVAPFDGVTNTSVMVIRPRRESDWPYVLMLCSAHATVEYATRMAQGLKMPTIKWADLARMDVVIPPDNLLDRYAEIAGHWLEMLCHTVRKMHHLKSARDSLAEKLFLEVFRQPNASVAARGE